MLTRHIAVGLAGFVTAAFMAGSALAVEADRQDPRLKNYIVGEKYSGYVVNEPETRDIQDDDFQNPAFLWVEQAQEKWEKVEGEAGKSCASCHGDVEESMKGKTRHYPLVHERTKKLVTVEHQIGICRKEHMKAKPWKWESDQMLGMAALVRMQSRDMPVEVKVDGEAKSHFEKGREFYFQRRGVYDLACAHCHVDNHGNKIRSELLSQGMPNGFPTYRMKWQKLGSLHRRFRGCNKNIRAEPYKQGTPEYTQLELYLMWRANGLPVETPSVRK